MRRGDDAEVGETQQTGRQVVGSEDVAVRALG